MADTTMEAADFSRLAAEMRPRLHRYCARMVGSAFDGEDVVQDALARAAEAYAAGGPIANPESWMFRIAHNAAIDALRRRKRQADGEGTALDEIADPAAAADARVAAEANLAAFLPLPALQRSSVVLIDVLGHALQETADILDATVAAVKTALHRGRARLRETAAEPGPPPPLNEADRVRLRHYADRFNARDFDALRSLLAEDVRLDVVGRVQAAGRKDVSAYFGRYSQIFDLRVAPGMAEGRPALLFSDAADPTGAVRYVVLLGWRDGAVESIRDFRYARYAMEAVDFARERLL
jgi:RNA polymerase sigma-70 factor (ECF subfamily)